MIPINRDPAALYPAMGQQVRDFVGDWNRKNPTEQIQIFEGLRSFARQRELYDQGRTRMSLAPCYHRAEPGGRAFARKPGTCAEHPLGAVVTNAPEGLSWHCYGLAVDLVFDADPVKPGLQASWDGRFPWQGLGRVGTRAGFEWAGNWKRFKEYPHFQNTYGLNLQEALELHRTGGLPAVWAAI